MISVVSNLTPIGRRVALLSLLAGAGARGHLLAQQTAICAFDTAAHTSPVTVTIAARVMRGDKMDAELTDTIGAILKAGAPFPASINGLFYPFTHLPARDSAKAGQAQVFGELRFVSAKKKSPQAIEWSDSTADRATNLRIDSLLHAADQVGRLQMLWDVVKIDQLPVRLELMNGDNHSAAAVLTRLSIPMVTLDSPPELRVLVVPESRGLGRTSGPVNLSFMVDESGEPVPSSGRTSSALPPQYVAAAIASAMKSHYKPARVAACAVKGEYTYLLFMGKRSTTDTVIESTTTRTRIPSALHSR